jgi:hypothetical protein
MKFATDTDLSARALAAVQHAASLREAAKSLGVDHPRRHSLDAVKAWQAVRLAATYADILQSSRYVDAANFFLKDLYGAADLSARDQEVKRMLPSLVKLLPKAALRTVVEALEMDALSEQLDNELADELIRYAPQLFESSMPTGERMGYAYQHCYRTMANVDKRYAQISTVLTIGNSLDKLVRQPMLGGLLAAMAGPAKMAGLANVYDFLWRGFRAFKKMRGAHEFLDIIKTRELAEDARLRGLVESVESGSRRSAD